MNEEGAGQVAYRPGPGTALVAGSCLVLLGPEVSRATATELWPVLDQAASLEELVEVVLEIGLRKLPTIAIAYGTGRETHVLLRGEARGAARSIDGGDVLLLDSDARTWKEHAVRGPVRMYLGEGAGGEYLPLSSGVVPADALSIGWPMSGDRPTAADGLKLQDVRAVKPPGNLGIEADEIADPPPSVLEYPDHTLTDTAFEELSGLESPRAPVVSMQRGDPPADPDEDNFDDLFGATRLPLPVEHAAIRAEDSESEELDLASVASEAAVSPVESLGLEDPPVPRSGLGTGGFLPPSARGPAVSAVGPPPADVGRLIDGVPGMDTGATSHSSSGSVSDALHPSAPVPPIGVTRENIGLTPPPVADVGDDGASMTVSRSALGKMRNKASPPPPPTSGQTVHGVMCDVGHPNPPAATVCRACALPLEIVDAVSMPRPVLGVLRFSNGIKAELDRPVIIGRAPKAERVSARELPQLVSLPSPDKDISRNHLEVKLDGWHVIVVDLGSTNGTVVTLPGQAPERLRAQEEQPISPGTVVTIAEEITFVYEVPT